MTAPRGTHRWSFLMAEAVLVVLSILLAFAIDAGWASRQEASERIELLEAIRADFAATDESLDEAIETAGQFVARTGGYLEVVAEEVPVPRDSLIFLLLGVADFTFYEPSLASYRNAVSMGGISFIRDPALLKAFTDFELAWRTYEQHLTLAGDMYYLGAVHDLRAAMGGFEGPAAGRGGERPTRGSDVYESRVLIPEDFDLRAKEAVAAAEALYWAHVNAWDALDRMDQAAQRVVAALDGILAERPKPGLRRRGNDVI